VSEIARGAAAMSPIQLGKVQVDADMHEILPRSRSARPSLHRVPRCRRGRPLKPRAPEAARSS
jgi:hypothetical protein